MRKPNKTMTSVLLAGLVSGGLVFHTATAATASTSPRTTVQKATIRVTEHVVSDRTFNLDGGSTTSVGTIELGAAQLRSHGVTVGRNSIECTATRVGKKTADDQCVETFIFKNGTVTVQGIILDKVGGPGAITMAVTGGTGRYAHARGYVNVDPKDSPVDTFYLTY